MYAASHVHAAKYKLDGRTQHKCHLKRKHAEKSAAAEHRAHTLYRPKQYQNSDERKYFRHDSTEKQ